MLQEEANVQLLSNGYNIKLFDSRYLGNKHPHNWICQCDNLISNKTFSSISKNKNILCTSCRRFLLVENNYKVTVESIPNYTFIKSYRSGDTVVISNKIITVKDSPYIKIKHESCGRTYHTTFGGFKQGKRCTCAPFESSVKFLYPEISNLIHLDSYHNLVDEKLKATIHANSGKKFYFKCKNCEEISDKCLTLASIVNKGYSCKYCSDGISIPEKFVINLLTDLDVQFEFHKSFKWSKKKVYDFYIPSLNLIIETHGIQHYEDSPRSTRTFEDEVENDRQKQALALANKIDYLVIDCRNSTLDWIKENCINILGNLFALKDTDWIKIWTESQYSYIKKSWNLWDSGKSLKQIAEVLKLAPATIRRYLNLGYEVNKCTYNSQKEKDRIKRKVICVTTGEIYESINLAAKTNGLTLKALQRCCNSKYKRLSTPESEETLIWMYHNDYLNTSFEELEKLKKPNPRARKKVLCITTGKIFNNQYEAGDYYNCERRNISSCCNGKRNYCGKLTDGTPLQWKFI
ncbi:hypothetical protein [Viridibacillus arvi]|uniref:hypothetical protein n=1 Tax=Viridibacillus arvi TaxID=263475 RepID=UPI0036E491C5